MAAAAAAAAALSAARNALRGSGAGARRGAGGVAVACAAVAAEAARAAVDGDVVFVHYKGRLTDGTEFDSSPSSKPLTVALGKHQVVPGFEEAILGLKLGEQVTVELPPEKAYGERNPAMIVTFEASQAPADLKEGMEVMVGAGSQRMPARVIKVAEDGAVTIDANHELAGKTLTFDIHLVGFQEPLAPAVAEPGTQLATFAAGCFWGVELAFQRVPGVTKTMVGYAQGQLEKPSYEEICTGQTGHTEAVRVIYKPDQVTYKELLDTFWERVGRNATTLNLAGNDRGPQYRSGIYFHNEEQRKIAEDSIKALQERLGEPVVTEVEAAAPFWLAEDYHQEYLEMGGRSGNPQSAEKGSKETIRCYG